MPVEQVSLTFPDGAVKQFDKGVTLKTIAESISSRLAQETIAGFIDNQLIDIHTPITDNATIRLLTKKDPEALEVLRHSTAHIMADAVQKVFPGTKVTIGPAIEHGFYYDFDRDTPFTPDDLQKIEKEMLKVIESKASFVREEVSRDEAYTLFKEMGEDYKLELLDAIPAGEIVSLYKHGQWVDLCRGPHLPSASKIKAFKLTSVAGAYWRGDEHNKMLQRIYGTAFWSKKELDAHLEMLEEAKRRDHRKLGKDLELFSIDESIGGGLVLWHPKGAFIRYQIEEFWRKAHLANGYDLVVSPHVARDKLWHRSGHLGWYKENMYSGMEVEGQDYLVKPMNCPFHITMYANRLRSYRELPLRWAELGTVYRYERSGVLHGLLRVRGFTQDDAHLFITEEILPQELDRLIDFNFQMLRSFGFEKFETYFSTKPEKYVGTDDMWQLAEKSLEEALQRANLQYKVDQGGGAFYGPKIDIKMRDSLGREWQCSTIQVDFALPERFNLEYVGEDGQRHRPIMLHRALLGSIERFFAVLVEHYAGNFPMWLAPEQARVLVVTDEQLPFAQSVVEAMKAQGIRAELDDRNEKLGAKIRLAETEKIPAMVIVGNKEVEQNGVTLRKKGGENIGFMSLDQAISFVLKETAIPDLPKT